jgi:CDP-6-deoxy-D-xylo-4-hexulose-3-dehydrase
MEFQAGLGVVQLEQFDEIIKKRQSNVKYLNDKLAKYSDFFILPKYNTDISYLAYPLILRDDIRYRDCDWLTKYFDLDEFRDKLSQRGVESRPLFGSIPTMQPAYSEYESQYNNKLPNADYLSKNSFYIGIHQYLTQEDLDNIVSAFGGVLGV